MSTPAKRLPKSRVAELDRAFKAMSPAAIRCRGSYGHAWEPFDAYWLPGRKFVDQRLRCSRCTTVRHRVLDQFGNVLSNSYIWPDGYLATGLGRLTGLDRGLLRLTSVLNDGVKDGPADDA